MFALRGSLWVNCSMVSNPEPKHAAKPAREPIAKLPPWLIAATLGALAALWTYCVAHWTPDTLLWTFRAQLVLLTLGAASLCLVCFGLICLRIWLRNRTHIAFGLMWDSNKNPICSSCHGPIGPTSAGSFFCSPCRSYFKVYDDLRGECNTWDVLSTVREHGFKAKLVKTKS
jgi:hypothetical protein